MDLDTLDKMAYKGLAAPGGLDQFDGLYYRLITDIYNGVKTGEYTFEDGKTLKAELRSAYDLIRRCEREK